MKCNILRADSVEKYYWEGTKKHLVLNNISITFEQGKTYAITGVSGSGKSTLLHVLGGLDEPTSGSVTFDGSNVYNLPDKHLFLNQKMGFVFQFHYLIKELTVLENVSLMGLIKGDPKKASFNRAQELLASFGLEGKYDRYPDQLSGGEQQRASIARALFNKPAFLLADEPTGNLDEQRAEELVEILIRAQREWNMGIILCSHDKKIYEQMETVFRLEQGFLFKK